MELASCRNLASLSARRGHVDGEDVEPDRRARAVDERLSDRADPVHPRSVGADRAVFDVERGMLLDRPSHRGADALAVVRVNSLERLLDGDRVGVRRHEKVGLHTLVPLQGLERQCRVPQADTGAFEHQLQALGRGAGFVLGLVGGEPVALGGAAGPRL
jgi:hypothetical protein